MYEGGLLLAAQPPDLLSDLRGNQAASYVANASWAATLQANAPEMAGKWDVIPLPAMTVGGNHTVSLGGSMLAALRTGKSQEAASAFMEYCLANKDTQNLMLRQFGLLPSFLPAYDNAFYSTPQPYFNNKPIWQFFAREVPQLKLIYYTKDFEQATDTATVAQLLALIQIDPTQALLRQSNDLKDLTAREVVKPGTSPTPNPGTRS
jgi:lactose/L-arabinose transport system substrate-binding protein